jgi:hypothetical protein
MCLLTPLERTSRENLCLLSSAKQDFRTSGLLADHLPDKCGTQDADDTVLNWVLSFFNCLWTRGL